MAYGKSMFPMGNKKKKLIKSKKRKKPTGKGIY